LFFGLPPDILFIFKAKLLYDRFPNVNIKNIIAGISDVNTPWASYLAGPM
jgi:hypothetical protein